MWEGFEIKYIRTKLKIRASIYQKGLLVAPPVGDSRSGRFNPGVENH